MEGVYLDTKGLDCPLPLNELKAALADAEAGQIIEIDFTCPEATVNIPTYCQEHGIEVLAFDSGWKAHQEAFLAEMRKTDPYYQCTGRHRPARYIHVEEQRPVEKQRWVVDRAAWSEQVVDVPAHWE